MSQYNEELRAVEIPEGTVTIAAGAFRGRAFVESVVIPDGVTKIGDSAFRACPNLKRVSLPSTLTEICADAFAWCRMLEEINLPDGLKKIGDNAFQDCCSLRGVKLPSKLTSVGSNAFYGVPLETIHIPASLKTVGSAAFRGAELTQVTIAEGVQKIGSMAFASTKLTQVRLPESLHTLDIRAFSGCMELKKMNLPLNLKTISHQIRETTGLEATKIMDCWLLEAENVTEYTIPAGIRKVGAGAFKPCDALRVLRIPGHEVDLGSVWLGFKSCLNRLQTLELISAPEYTLEECPEQLLPYMLTGWMTDHWNGKLLTQDPAQAYATARASMTADTTGLWKRLLSGCREALYDAIKGQALPVPLTDELLEDNQQDKELALALLDYKNTAVAAEPIPDVFALSEEPEESVGLCLTKKEAGKLWTVKKLEDDTWRVSAYKGTDPVMVIPAYIDDLPVTEVGRSPKAACKVQQVQIPDTVTAIAVSAFQDFINLHTLTIGKGVTFIGSKAFMGCGKLTQVELPPKLGCIPHWLFAGCGKLEVLKITGEKTVIEADANFLRGNRKAVLWIHRGNTKVMEYLSTSKRQVEFL